jgi:signal transduction histidine kinase
VALRLPVELAYPSRRAFPWAALAALLAAHVAVAGLFAWGAARSVTGPVERLTAEAERIASGELTVPIPPLGEDELGRLGRALDHMRARIHEALGRVEAANEVLEARVAERTLALERANQALRERAVARGEILSRVIAAQEDERRRVARELHDETTQSLAALLLGLGRAAEEAEPGRRPALEALRGVAARALDEVHRLILDLRPAVLDDLGLPAAIRWCGERTLEARGTAVRYEFGELGRLPPELETALFRMVQEAFANVARHAQATQVLVEVEAEGGTIHLAVEDDGRGFTPGTPAADGRRHWGLAGIGERAALAGGRAAVDSAPGAGTRLDVHIPLPPEVT